GRLDTGSGQIRVDGKVEPGWPAFSPAQDEMRDGIDAYSAQLQRLLYGRMQIGQSEAFQKTQHSHIGAPTQLAHPRVHQPTQCGERRGEFPALERGRLVERIDLVLEQRQVMQWVKDDVFAPITARMTGDGLPAAADHHLSDIATDPGVL